MRRIWIVLLVLTGLFLSCEKSPLHDCFNSTGPVITVERDVADFNSILLRHNVNLYLRQAQKNKLTLKAGSNLMEKIVTSVNEEGQLEIRNENSCNWVRSFDIPIDVYLDFVKLDSLEYRSIGDVFAEETLFLDTLKLDVLEGAGKIELNLDANTIYCGLSNSTADVVLKGFCELSYLYAAGFGRIDNRELVSKFVYVNNKSSNDVYLQVTTELGATIENIGNIYYSGSPAVVNLNQLGTGKLIKLD